MASSPQLVGIALILGLACAGAADPTRDSGSGGGGGGAGGGGGGGGGTADGGGRGGGVAPDGGPVRETAVADAPPTLDGNPADVAAGEPAPETRTDMAAPDASSDRPDADLCGSAVLGASCSEPGKICGSERCMQACGFCNLLRCDGGSWRRLEVPPPQQPCDASSG